MLTGSSLAVVLIVAGSETTSTTLTAATYYLLANPSYYEKLKHEIRTNFRSQSDITLQNLAKQPYLMACIEEAVSIMFWSLHLVQ